MILLLTGLLASSTALAQDPPVSQEEIEGAETDTIELDKIEVVSGISVQEETALRIIRHALDQPRSRKRKDFDKWVCWLNKPVGTHLNHLHCARNGDLWALKPGREGGRISGADLNPAPIGDYGRLMVSSRPVNRSKLNRILGQLNGPEGFDEEFVSLVLKGTHPPRDVPSDEEMDQFAQAWQAVGELELQDATEIQQIEAIRSEGLSLERYNRIATLVEEHPSINKAVATRVTALK